MCLKAFTGECVGDRQSSEPLSLSVPLIVPKSCKFLILLKILTKIKKAVISDSLSVRGGEGNRTPDLLNAIQTLYQLSYTPEQHGDNNVKAEKMSSALALLNVVFIAAEFRLG